MNRLSPFIFPLFIVILGILTYTTVVKQGPQPVTGSLQIEVAPKSAKVTVDDASINVGTHDIEAGSHKVTYSKKGFASITDTVQVPANGKAYSGEALKPNSNTTQNWYTDNSKDQELANGIGSHRSDFLSTQASQQNSFLQSLPQTIANGRCGFTSINQGVPVAGSNSPSIYIRGDTPADRQTALDYIHNQGYDLATMDFVFVGLTRAIVGFEGE